MTMGAEYTSKLASLHRYKWRLHMSGKKLEWHEKTQANKQTNKKKTPFTLSD